MQMYDAIIHSTLGIMYRTTATGLCYRAKCANIIVSHFAGKRLTRPRYNGDPSTRKLICNAGCKNSMMKMMYDRFEQVS